MASNQDDSFREIQLGGKQLVFLAMAVVVIGVSVFLAGVMVGRGVLAAKGPMSDSANAGSSLAAAETDPPPPPASASPGSSASPATAGEKLSYAERLGATEPPKEPLPQQASPEQAAPTPKPESAAATPVAAEATAKPAPATPPAPPDAPPVVPMTTEPAGSGFAIQVAALREAEEADAMAKRLAGKGYPAYVVSPQRGSAPIYRVRVGKFKERREADTIAARLQKEEQFKPWTVR
jgi:cell division septation protein DedD